MKPFWIALLIILVGLGSAQAANIIASSCNSSDVSTAIGSASDGDTITVPAGTCTWSTFSISKAVSLQGAGSTQTLITLTGTVTLTKSSAGVMRFSDMHFEATGGGSSNQPFLVVGGGTLWRGARAIVFQNNDFVISGSGLFRIEVAGGMVFASNTFTGGWDDGFFQIKNPSDSDGSWSTPDTMGSRDVAADLGGPISGTIAGTRGELNHYFEDNTFHGGSNGGFDCDDACRIVVRHNHFIDSSFNSHGYDTSSWGMRHFEISFNDFRNTCSEAGGTAGACGTVTASLPNVNQQIWLRGGTGIICCNQMENNSNSAWGTKPQVRLNIRAVSQPSLIGRTCGNLTYPVLRALGQNFNGSFYFTDPIYIWGNTVKVQGSSGSTWTQPEVDSAGGPWPGGEECSPLLNWISFFQWSRDAKGQAISGGTAKAGYTQFTYPHPLASGGDTVALASTTFSISGSILTVPLAGVTLTLSGGTTSGSSCTAPQPYPCGRTDTATIPLPARPNVGGLSGANTVITDPDFGERIVRVTDSSYSNSNMMVSNGGGDWDTHWNANSTRLIVMRNGGVHYLVSFNTTTMQTARMYGSFTFTGDVQFSHSDPNVFYVLSGTQIKKYDITNPTTTPTPTTVVDFTAAGSNCLAAGYWSGVPSSDQWNSFGGVSLSDDSFTAAFSNVTPNGGQNSGSDIVAWTAAKGCIHLDTSTGNITADLGWGGAGSGLTCTTSCTGTISGTTDRITIHSVINNLDGTWLDVGMGTCVVPGPGLCTNGGSPYVWKVGTNIFQPFCSVSCGGHSVMGNTKWVNAGSGTGVLRIRDIGDQTGVSNINPAPSNYSTAGNLGLHIAWRMVDVNDTQPMIVTHQYTNSGGGCCIAPTNPPAGTWWNEGLAVSPTTGTVWRLFRSWASGDSPFFTAKQFIATCSQDGKWCAFTSDWLGSLGSTSGGSSCTVSTNCRSDVFVADLRKGTTSATLNTTTSNSTGAYSFSGLANGTYTVTPSNTGYTFTPASRTVTINNGNVTGVNFTQNSLFAPVFVQQNSTTSAGSLSSTSTVMPLSQANGDTNVVFIGWHSATDTVSSVTDTRGNTYDRALGPLRTASGGGLTIYAYTSRLGSTGSNTINVAFSTAVPQPDVRVASYRGISGRVLEATNATGSTATSNSGTLSQMSQALLVGSNYVTTTTTGPGTGFTQRAITSLGNIVEDRIITVLGSYGATAPVSPTGQWMMTAIALQ